MILDQSALDIGTFVEKIRKGEIDIQPNFQRGQVWPDTKKRRLIDTILRQWYIPAVHLVVNDALDKDEVLDGQQRLRAIMEFMDDEFGVDGTIQPPDDHILKLDGFHYSQLPTEVKSRFKRFAISTVRLRNYEPDEPGELFFRLNQLTSLTSAEQRNALVGKPRNDIRKLVSQLESRTSHLKIGFSNARMNFDDTLARFAMTLETGHLGTKIAAADLEARYRSGKGFDDKALRSVSHSIETLISSVEKCRDPIKLNRATLFSWLFFIADNEWFESNARMASFTEFFASFEAARAVMTSGSKAGRVLPTSFALRLIEAAPCRRAIHIFTDRASSRVNDISSVLWRDLALNLCWSIAGPPSARKYAPLRERWQFLHQAATELESSRDRLIDQADLEASLAKRWEEHRARS